MNGWIDWVVFAIFVAASFWTVFCETHGFRNWLTLWICACCALFLLACSAAPARSYPHGSRCEAAGYHRHGRLFVLDSTWSGGRCPGACHNGGCTLAYCKPYWIVDTVWVKEAP